MSYGRLPERNCGPREDVQRVQDSKTVRMSWFRVKQMSIADIAARAQRLSVYSGTRGVCKACQQPFSEGEGQPYKMIARYHYFRLCASCDAQVQECQAVAA
jgi:hypothetical protein